MLITQMIIELGKLLDKHGDIECGIPIRDGGDAYSVNYIAYEESEIPGMDHKPFILISE